MIFLDVQFWERFLGASEGFRGEFWGPFWRALGPLFLLPDQEFVMYAKKSSLGVFLGAKSIGLRLQKHANRAVHPLKIEGVLAMVQSFQHVSQRLLFCHPKARFGGSKQHPACMFLGT